MNFHSVWRNSTSTPAVGSSSTITGGRCTSACATSTRRFMPPDSARMLASALSVRSRLAMISSIHVVVVAQPVVARLDAQRFAHGEERIEHEFLRHDAERAARGAEIGDDVVAAHRDAAFVGAREARENADERGLARAVRTEQAEELAFFHREADALERLQLLVALLDVTNFYG